MDATRRTIDLKIEVDLWDWSSLPKSPSAYVEAAGGDEGVALLAMAAAANSVSPSRGMRDTINITRSVQSYRFQKSIKTPKGSLQLGMLPQITSVHILDTLSPMDVIRVYEFGTLKFIGYIKRISYSGAIGAGDGKPSREATITAVQFGGLLTEATIGYGLGSAMGRGDGLLSIQSTKLTVAIINAVSDGTSYAELMRLVYEKFVDFLDAIGALSFTTYLDTYLDSVSGLQSSVIPLFPRQWEMYTGTETSLTFWQVAEQLVQRPLNEFWIDNGPRKVSIDGISKNLSEKSSFVFRETPFDGRSGGSEVMPFSNMPVTHIDKNHALRFDLARGMDAVYTVYKVKEASFALDDVVRVHLGQWVLDRARLGKYLFRPLISELFYTRNESQLDTEIEVPQGDIQSAGTKAAGTLFSWFANNDEFLSGSISHMVPSDGDADPKIGEKLSVYGIEGHFYVEGIAHTWQYGGPLQSSLSVTRGYNGDRRIEMHDKIFNRNQIR